MKVLHVYPESNQLIQQHVMMLADGMRQSAEVFTACKANVAKKLMEEREPDIVHVHGCDQLFLLRTLRSACNDDFRTVVTPHGQLEPWGMQQQENKDKVGKWLMLRDSISKAYAVITLGRLERTNFEALGWNPRMEEIHNAVTTNTTTQEEMCSKTFAVYQKITDSNTLAQMDEESIHTLATIIKAGITGDRRWISEPPRTSPDWRRLLIYAEQENIRNYVDYGINILGLSTPILDTTRIDAYFPTNYVRPRPLKEIIGDYQGDENAYIVNMIQQIHKQPLLLHLIELTRELYRDSIDDERLEELLEKKSLTGFAARLMQVLSEQTLLDEGYMPLSPINDKQTQQIRNTLTNHLKI